MAVLKNFIVAVVLTLLILVIIFFTGYRVGLRKCNKQITSDTVYSITTDTITKDTIIFKPKPFKEIVPVTDTIRDTVFVLKDYNTVRIYDRNIIKDDRADISIIDTVYHNELQGYSVKAKFYVRDTIKYIYTVVDNNTKPKPHIYLGGQVGFDLKGNTSVAPSLLYVSKNNKHSYSINYDIFNNKFEVGYFFRVF